MESFEVLLGRQMTLRPIIDGLPSLPNPDLATQQEQLNTMLINPALPRRRPTTADPRCPTSTQTN